jgi:hypothetical protein
VTSKPLLSHASEVLSAQIQCASEKSQTPLAPPIQNVTQDYPVSTSKTAQKSAELKLTQTEHVSTTTIV